MQSLSDAHKRSQRLWDCPCYATSSQLWSTLAGELSAQGIQNWAPNVLSALVIVTALLEFPLQGLEYQEKQAVWDAVDFEKGFSTVLDESLSKHLTFSGFLFLEIYVLVFFGGTQNLVWAQSSGNTDMMKQGVDDSWCAFLLHVAYCMYQQLFTNLSLISHQK